MKRAVWIIIISLILAALAAGCSSQPSPRPVSSHNFLFHFNPPRLEESILKVQGYSTSVEITWPAAVNNSILKRTDPQYAEFMHLFALSIEGPISSNPKLIHNDQTLTPNPTTSPSPGYILDFSFQDGSDIWFNASGEDIWYESDDVTYRGICVHSWMDWPNRDRPRRRLRGYPSNRRPDSTFTKITIRQAGRCCCLPP